jgi:nucleoside-diphosphate-sugar epimerase
VNILIIGGTGFIGPHVVHGLVAKGHNVALFHRGQTAPELPASVIHIHGERQYLDDFASQFESFSPQVVLDMIAYTEDDARLVTQTFRDVAERLVCVSSMDVYRAYNLFRRVETGIPDLQSLDEEAPLRSAFYPYRSLSQSPNDFLDFYDKILVEQVVMNEPDLPGTVLRLPQVFGPNDGQRRLMAYLKSMDEGKDILLDEGKAEWRWTRGYVENVAIAIVLAVTDQKALGRVYNVGEKQVQREIDWIKEIGRLAGWRGEVKTVPRVALPEHLKEPYDWSHDLAADTDRIRRELGYEETVSPKEALCRTIAWERANPPKRGAGSQTPVQADAINSESVREQAGNPTCVQADL